jgi:DNA-binding beta-propeller fold protein YncE
MTHTRFTGRTLRFALALSAVLGAAQVLPAAAEVLYVASNRIEVIDSETGKLLTEIPVGHFVFDIAFSSDGSRAYLAVDEGVLEVDATKHAVIGRILDGPTFRVALSADGKHLYALGNGFRRLADGQQEALPSHLTTFDLAQRTVVSRHPVGDRAEDMALVAGQAAVTYPQQRELSLVSLTDGATASRTAFNEKTDAETAPGFINGLATSPEGARIYLGQFGDQSEIHVVDVATGARTALPFKHEGFITGVEVSPDGRALYVTTRNHLAIMDAATGAERAFIPLGGAHMKMALSRDGRRSYHTLPAADERGGAVSVVDLAAGKIERTIPTPGISAVTIGVQP